MNPEWNGSRDLVCLTVKYYTLYSQWYYSQRMVLKRLTCWSRSLFTVTRWQMKWSWDAVSLSLRVCVCRVLYPRAPVCECFFWRLLGEDDSRGVYIIINLTHPILLLYIYIIIIMLLLSALLRFQWQTDTFF